MELIFVRAIDTYDLNRFKMFNIAGEKGFTLIETLMAIAIISIGLLGLAALQTNAMSGNTRAQKQTEAIRLANNKIESFRNNAWNNIPPPESETEEGTELSTWGIFTRITDIQLNTCQDGTTCPGNLQCCGIASVRVRVSWPRRTEKPVDIQTTIVQK